MGQTITQPTVTLVSPNFGSLQATVEYVVNEVWNDKRPDQHGSTGYVYNDFGDEINRRLKALKSTITWSCHYGVQEPSGGFNRSKYFIRSNLPDTYEGKYMWIATFGN
uniref:Uncharacterized protein n=1 Tax=Panagrolaimus davidi TaxID=227884 RepID=A0A914PRR5_9BILA